MQAPWRILVSMTSDCLLPHTFTALKEPLTSGFGMSLASANYPSTLIAGEYLASVRNATHSLHITPEHVKHIQRKLPRWPPLSTCTATITTRTAYLDSAYEHCRTCRQTFARRRLEFLAGNTERWITR